MEDAISYVKQDYAEAKQRFLNVFAAVPDDKVNFSPSPTARSPLQQMAHVASSIPSIQGILSGMPFPFASVQEADRQIREHEKQLTSKAEILDLFEKNSKDYFAWLDTLTPEQLESEIQMPLGKVPLKKAVWIMAQHIRMHTAQIEYIQTIYGDFEWRF